MEAGENQQVKLEINLTEKYIAFDRSKALTPGAISYRKAKLETIEKLKILCDTNSLEVFIDEGKMAFTNTFFFSSPESSVILENKCSGQINYSFWEIRKI
ncbi:MAG: GH32 C-terminal domain-containing protein [Treponema sp.]|nr:GH32 C-terminal domain-containing protein [Treponema sp.]